MSADSEFIDYLLELLEGFGIVQAKRMFGGHGLFRDGLMFALIADEVLYFKVDDEVREDFSQRNLEAFTYYKKGKPMQLSYYQAPEEAMDNNEDMHVWAAKAYDAAVRADAKKQKRKKK